jgi:hypothetical protein
VAATGQGQRFAVRSVSGIDDAGGTETVSLWIEWQPGGVWAVGRAVNAEHRENPAMPRADDWIFTGYEMADALEAANDALEADLSVSSAPGDVPPFAEDELRHRLERWFFDR